MTINEAIADLEPPFEAAELKRYDPKLWHWLNDLRKKQNELLIGARLGGAYAAKVVEY